MSRERYPFLHSSLCWCFALRKYRTLIRTRPSKDDPQSWPFGANRVMAKWLKPVKNHEARRALGIFGLLVVSGRMSIWGVEDLWLCVPTRQRRAKWQCNDVEKKPGSRDQKTLSTTIWLSTCESEKKRLSFAGDYLISHSYIAVTKRGREEAKTTYSSSRTLCLSSTVSRSAGSPPEYCTIDKVADIN